MIRFFWFSLLLPLSACRAQEPEPVAKGARHLGIHLTTAEERTYQEAFGMAADAGMDVVPLGFAWTTLEPSPRVYDSTWLAVLDAYYSASDMPVSLFLMPITALDKTVPADLMGLPFDHPEMIARFDSLLSFIRSQIQQAELNNLIIGNEVDLYLNAHPEEWAAYTAFFRQTRAHARNLWGPALPIGAETTYSSLAGASAVQAEALHADADMVVFSYYPLKPDFTMDRPAVIGEVVDDVAERYPGKRLFLEETGYASGKACGGSEQRQAEYVQETFRAWDRYADRLMFVGFLWMHDLSDAETEGYVQLYGMRGQPAEAAFAAYLQTLGLRTWPGSGRRKPAWDRLAAESAARGWR
ncbi:MAG: hypothetical protein NW241_03330 [Bacteroidia bacterium]|nr:hypothetical protein [Bacteroidia bacterium]